MTDSDPVPNDVNSGKTPDNPRKVRTGDQISLKIIYFLMVSVLAVIIVAILANIPVIRMLSQSSFARGLITFIITVATIGLAFVLVFQAFALSTENEDNFRRAREIFAGLMGVLGTIVGFYFGSAEKPSASLQLATVKIADKQLITYVSGGTPPYHYVITSTDANFKEVKESSEEGWIVENFATSPISGSKVTVSVTDSKEDDAKRTIVIPVMINPKQEVQQVSK